MQLNEIQIKRLEDFLLKVRGNSIELSKQTWIVDNYTSFYDQYNELTSFLHRLDNSNIEFVSIVSSFPKMPSPDKVWGMMALKVAYFFLFLNPLIGIFFFFLLLPVSLPLIIVSIVWTLVLKQRLEKIKSTIERFQNLLVLKRGELLMLKTSER